MNQTLLFDIDSTQANWQSYPVNLPYYKGNIMTDRHITPVPLTPTVNQWVVNGTRNQVDVRVGPGNDEISFFRLSNRASEYLQYQYDALTAVSNRVQIRIPCNPAVNLLLPPDVYRCSVPNIGGVVRVDNAKNYIQLRANQQYWAQHLDASTNHFSVGVGVIGRLPKYAYATRLVYAEQLRSVLLPQDRFLATDGRMVYPWFWCREWSPGHSLHNLVHGFSWCSHLCHNKLCVDPRHIVLEPALVNRDRQSGIPNCPGWIVAAKHYQPTEDAIVVDYQCCHAWGCRRITAIPLPPSTWPQLQRMPWANMVYRSGHAQFNLREQ
jgi:hypothetical protein